MMAGETSTSSSTVKSLLVFSFRPISRICAVCSLGRGASVEAPEISGCGRRVTKVVQKLENLGK